jgi:PAS domain S-box-containing protein
MLEKSIKEIITAEVVSVSPETPLSQAVSLMEDRRISCLLIVRDKKPAGIFTERDLVRAVIRGDYNDDLQIKNIMTEAVVSARSDMIVYEAYNLLRKHKVRHLVVVDEEGSLCGIVTQTDLMNNLGLEYFIEFKSLSEIMTHNVVTLGKDNSVAEALSAMAEHSISCIVIEEAGKPAGIITERDAIRLARSIKNILPVKAGEVMSSPVVAIPEDYSIYDSAGLMRRKRIRRLVITDKDGRIAGLITQSDIIKRLEQRYIETLKEILREKEEQLSRIEKSLKEKSLYLDNILSSSTDMAIAATDLDFRITYYNPMAEKIFGYKAEDVVGKTVMDVHTKEKVEPSRFEKAIDTVRRTGEYRYSVEQKKDGDIRYIESRVSGIWDKNKELVGFVLMSHDVTKEKMLEAELLKVQKLESLGILAGGIAHDFNNLLTAIMGNISLAMMQLKSGDPVCERLSEAEKASLRARDLTHQLLTFSKGGEPVKKLSSIAEIIKDAAGFALRGTNVTCEYLLPADLRPVEIDEGQISQAVNNLVINAVHAMPGGGAITISAENAAIRPESGLPLNEGAYVLIKIRDTGIGIPKEYLPMIFDPYFTTKKKGSGLGLAVTFSIIKNHSGHITVESEPGIGTIFGIYLPASDRELVRDVVPEERILKGKGRILIMDDEEIIRDVAGAILQEAGYEVFFAGDGEEAVGMYKEGRESGRGFDLVIMDLTVPGGMGGKETIQKLMEIDPQVNAIVSSGYSNDPIMADCCRYGFKGIVTKPYQAKALVEEVRRVIAGIS